MVGESGFEPPTSWSRTTVTLHRLSPSTAYGLAGVGSHRGAAHHQDCGCEQMGLYRIEVLTAENEPCQLARAGADYLVHIVQSRPLQARSPVDLDASTCRYTKAGSSNQRSCRGTQNSRGPRRVARLPHRQYLKYERNRPKPRFRPLSSQMAQGPYGRRRRPAARNSGPESHKRARAFVPCAYWPRSCRAWPRPLTALFHFLPRPHPLAAQNSRPILPTAMPRNLAENLAALPTTLLLEL